MAAVDKADVPGWLVGKRVADQKEPVFFNGLPPIFWDNFVKTYKVKKMIFLTAGPPNVMLAMMKANVAYLGVCLTEFHKEAAQHTNGKIMKQGCQTRCTLVGVH